MQFNNDSPDKGSSQNEEKQWSKEDESEQGFMELDRKPLPSSS
jgi:hypothetical protein